MQALIPLGAIVSIAGLGLLLWCIVSVARLKRAGLEGDAFRARMQRIVALNMIALMVSVIGLMLVVIGMALG